MDAGLGTDIGHTSGIEFSNSNGIGLLQANSVATRLIVQSPNEGSYISSGAVDTSDISCKARMCFYIMILVS